MGQLADHRFTALLEAAPDAMICADRDGRIALVNAQAERLFGYTRDELAGQPVEILVPDEAHQVHPVHRAGYLANPRPRPMGAGMQLAADAATAALSRPRSPCPPSTPTRVSWSPRPSGM